MDMRALTSRHAQVFIPLHTYAIVHIRKESLHTYRLGCSSVCTQYLSIHIHMCVDMSYDQYQGQQDLGLLVVPTLTVLLKDFKSLYVGSLSLSS